MRLLNLVLLAVLAAATFAAPVGAQDLEDELAEVRSEVEAVSSQISQATAERSTLAADVLATEGTLDGLLVELGQTRLALDAVRVDLGARERDLGLTRVQLANLYRDLEKTRVEIADGLEAAQEWARQLYMTAGQDEAFLALSSTHLSEVSLGMEYLDRVASETDRDILTFEALRQFEERQKERIELREASLEDQVSELAAAEAEVAELEASQSAHQSAIQSELDRQRGLLGQVEGELAYFEGELAALEAEQSGIEAAINREVAKQPAATAGPAPTSGGGGFVRPVPGGISSGFGPRVHPILGYSRMHTGLDFSAPYGQSIVAAAGGTVIMAQVFGGYGNAVVIDHGGGMTTLYAHQSSFNVSYGQQVGAGAVIGFVGSTGLSTGPHLHFEVRINGSPANPAPYL